MIKNRKHIIKHQAPYSNMVALSFSLRVSFPELIMQYAENMKMVPTKPNSTFQPIQINQPFSACIMVETRALPSGIPNPEVPIKVIRGSTTINKNKKGIMNSFRSYNHLLNRSWKWMDLLLDTITSLESIIYYIVICYLIISDSIIKSDFSG